MQTQDGLAKAPSQQAEKTKPPVDLTDEVGQLLALRPSEVTPARVIELLLAAQAGERTQLVSILHVQKGNQFLLDVVAALSNEQRVLLNLGVPDGAEAPVGVETAAAGELATVGPALGLDPTQGYIPHETLGYSAPELGGEPLLRVEDAPGADASIKQERNATNRGHLDASNTEARIAGLERLLASLPKTKASIGTSAAIMAELYDLRHDRNLLDGDDATKPWIGNRQDKSTRQALHPGGYNNTDCTEYVDKSFRDAMKSIGQEALVKDILAYAHSTAAKNNAGKELYSGVDMQRALSVKLGWKSAYIDEGGASGAVRHNKQTGADTFYRAPVATKLLSTEAVEAKRQKLSEIPFAIITVNAGGHMKMLARGVVYECHWNDTGPYLFEAGPLAEEHFSQTLLCAPAADIDKLQQP